MCSLFGMIGDNGFLFGIIGGDSVYHFQLVGVEQHSFNVLCASFKRPVAAMAAATRFPLVTFCYIE